MHKKVLVRNGQVIAPGQPLTARERTVIAALAKGRTDRELAEVLGVSHHTFKTHVKCVLQKLAARNRTHAVAIAFRRGLIR